VNRLILAASSLGIFFSLFSANPSFSQEVIVYAPIQPEYRLGSFQYTAPQVDGWRQIANESDVLRLVYVEQLGPETFNTRVDVVAEAFEIPDPELVPSGLALAQSGQQQQMEARGEAIAGYTRLEALPSAVEAYAYTISLKLTEEQKRYETFVVAIAPDKTEYLVVKITVDEDEYTKQQFFLDIYESMKTIQHPGKAAPAAPDGQKQASNGRPAAPVVE
jgi:hypothetical protein